MNIKVAAFTVSDKSINTRINQASMLSQATIGPSAKPHVNVKVYMPIFARPFDEFYLWYASRYTCMSEVLISPIPLWG